MEHEGSHNRLIRRERRGSGREAGKSLGGGGRAIAYVGVLEAHQNVDLVHQRVFSFRGIRHHKFFFVDNFDREFVTGSFVDA
jgi:hypothetical protein